MIFLNPLFSDGAVLQRGRELEVWGSTDDDSEILVAIQGKTAIAVPKGGKWSVKLPPLQAAAEETMTVSSRTAVVTVENIAVGEVWIAAGQSNMEFPMYGMKDYDVVKNYADTQLRFFGVPRISYPEQLEEDDFSDYNYWRRCTPMDHWFISGVAFYFAKNLREHLHVPVGIINMNMGGTRAAAWTDRDKLRGTAAEQCISEYEAAVKQLNLPEYEAMFKGNPLQKVHAQDYDHLRIEMWKGKNPLKAWRDEKKLAEMMADMPVIPMGPLDRNRPGGLYESMVLPVVPYTVSGVIWYQGEDDESRPELYSDAMKAVIASWREAWRAELPFLMVQLAPYAGTPIFPITGFAAIRNIQRKIAEEVPMVYAVNIMDAGMKSDIHPKDKKPVGERLARTALATIYGRNILWKAPKLIRGEAEGHTVRLEFSDCGSGLIRTGRDVNAWHISADGKTVEQFRVRVNGTVVQIATAQFEIAKRIEIAYGLENYSLCRVACSAGIPLEPFRTEIIKC